MGQQYSPCQKSDLLSLIPPLKVKKTGRLLYFRLAESYELVEKNAPVIATSEYSELPEIKCDL